MLVARLKIYPMVDQDTDRIFFRQETTLGKIKKGDEFKPNCVKKQLIRNKPSYPPLSRGQASHQSEIIPAIAEVATILGEAK